MIKANDTDIVVLAVSVMMPLMEIGLDQLLIASGQGAKTCSIPVHQLVENIGLTRASSQPFFPRLHRL